MISAFLLSCLLPSQSLTQQLQKEPAARLAKEALYKGDPYDGSLIFHRPQMSCTKCHTAGETAILLGPDLAKPDGKVDPTRLVEALLDPSKTIRKGFETVVTVDDEGKSISGIVVEENQAAVTIRDGADPTKTRTIARNKIESLKKSPTSSMPTGLVDQLTDRAQFVNLVAYLYHCAEYGPARARALRPPAEVINPKLPSYEAEVDHAGFIRDLGTEQLKLGAKLYERLCLSCHGTPDREGSMPTSRKFGKEKFKNGAGPHEMYRTLTYGYGMMAPQSELTPTEKYAVVHYIRETYLKAGAEPFVAATPAYLEKLPAGKSRGPTPPPGEPWKLMDYGNALHATIEASPGNVAYKGIAVRLDPGPGGVAAGKAWMLYDHGTMRAVAGWTGSGFIDWKCIHFDGGHWNYPKIVGDLVFETPDGPGWANPATGSFDDPRPKDKDGKHYGPMPKEWMEFVGVWGRFGRKRPGLNYHIGETAVVESGRRLDQFPGILFRSFSIRRAGPTRLTLCIAGAQTHKPFRIEKSKHLVHADGTEFSAAVHYTAGKYELRHVAGKLVLDIDLPDDSRQYFVVAVGDRKQVSEFAAQSSQEETLTKELSLDRGTTPVTAIGEEVYPPLTTKVECGDENVALAADRLVMPVKNPMNARIRPTGLDFLDDSAVVLSAWDGDLWRIDGVNGDAELTWRRAATGLFQPLGVRRKGIHVYVTCRDQLAELYAPGPVANHLPVGCFNTDHQVTTHFHEFAMDLQTDAEGNFYYTKGARHALPATVPQHGTLLKVCKDGKRTDILATGFRAPNGVLLNDDGTFYVTDQEGHWIPKNRINRVKVGGFYGNMMGATNVTDPSDAAMEKPICWITNRFDRSPAELVRVPNESVWGPLAGRVLNLSYGTGGIYLLCEEEVDGVRQGGVTKLPLANFPTGVMRGRFHPKTHHLYACGMYSWAGNQHQPGGFYRIRPTGKPWKMLTDVRTTPTGLAVTFSDAIAKSVEADPKNFGVMTWDIERSANYGSQHSNERTLKIAKLTLAADGKTVQLEIPDLKPTPCYELWYSIPLADGTTLDGIYHGTIHRKPTK